MTDQLKTYSVVLNWQDGDHEQGTFGATVRARDEQHAELQARRAMRAAYCDQEMLSDMEEADLEPAEKFGGSVIEISEGAIWHAKELEHHLRFLLTWIDDMVATEQLPKIEFPAAKAVIAEIDKIIAEPLPDEDLYPVTDWQAEVAAGDTRLGYDTWIAAKKASA